MLAAVSGIRPDTFSRESFLSLLAVRGYVVVDIASDVAVYYN